MTPNQLTYIPNLITAESFGALRVLILREIQKSGLNHNHWRIEEIVNPKTGETLRFNYYFKSEADDYEIQKEQLKIEVNDGD